MFEKGDKIKNYTLEKYLGEGSFGEVWLATKNIELSDEGILVALKFLKYKPSKKETEASFISKVRREVATWIRASGHKNIVAVQDGFQFQTDTFVIVSDYAEGGDLRNWLDKNGGKSPDLKKTVEIMCEILEGLQHLHTQTPEKIIHRDLKPDNILFKNSLPCITDFGVSRMANTMTNSMVKGTSAGTPLYISPESLEQKAASRSMDIWSMGVMLYEMLSGKYPYSTEENNVYGLLLDIIQNPPQPLPSNIPNEFQKIVAKALEKDVTKRFQTANEMREALKNPQQFRVKDSATIFDEDFDKTEQLKIEQEKQRQREQAEQARLEKERLLREKEERAKLHREAEIKRLQRADEEKNRPSNAQTFTNSIGMEFVLIPSGSFMMGSPIAESGRGQETDELSIR